MDGLLTTGEVAGQLRIGRSRLYELMDEGFIRYVHIGKLRRITPEAVADYIARLEADAHARMLDEAEQLSRQGAEALKPRQAAAAALRARHAQPRSA
jgi:excisionase family DNA binding protein